MLYKIENAMVLTVLFFQNLIVKILIHILWPRSLQPKEGDRICVYKPGNIGDLMCAIPSLNAIRKEYAGHPIVLLTHGGGSLDASVILKDHPAIDEISVFSLEDLRNGAGHKRLIRRVKSLNTPFLIVLPPENAGFLSQLKHLYIFFRCGFRSVRGFRISFFNHLNQAQYHCRKFDREVMRMLKALPFPYTEVDFSYPIADADRQTVEEKLSSLGIENKKILLMSPVGKAPANSWPGERFHEIAVQWNECGGAAVLIGGKIDDSLIQTICGDVGYDLSGQLSIQQSLYLMSRADTVLSVDTGTAHMASVTGTRLIGLYSSRNMPEQWFPYGENVTVLSVDMPCSPCRKKVCPKSNLCMKAITVDEVWTHLKKEFENA